MNLFLLIEILIVNYFLSFYKFTLFINSNYYSKLKIIKFQIDFLLLN